MSKTDNIIEVKNLAKEFGSLKAVDNISFEVKKGELFGILGPNGAGKTTTLEIMETLQRQSSGEVIIDGFNTLSNHWEVKSLIGVQLQASGFYPELNLIDLLNVFAALYDVKVNPLEMLKEIDLEDKKKSFFLQLSGGQKQRFSIISTLINQPKIIFLDEPTTGLDPNARIHLWEMIGKIKKKGVTILLTTHYMEEAESLCDRVAIMDQGTIIKIGTPRDLIDDLLKTGFKKPVERKQASLEDVFLKLTGRKLHEEA